MTYNGEQASPSLLKSGRKVPYRLSAFALCRRRKVRQLIVCQKWDISSIPYLRANSDDIVLHSDWTHTHVGATLSR
jgi:hypothetical protein